jgi:Domain of unknown function (DUF5060)
MSKKFTIGFVAFCLLGIAVTDTHAQSDVGLHRIFERSVVNDTNYANKFTGVNLTTTFTSPSGVKTNFLGFYDGDGNGGGTMLVGNVWKFRYMPNELGDWTYTWAWSDGTPGGEGTFTCVSENAGKGILRPYKDNPRWFAYNGTEPVFLKSYYENSMRPFAQPWEGARQVYETILNRGYNHLQINWVLPTVAGNNFTDFPVTSTKPIYTEKGKASSTMNLDVWKNMEGLLGYLNEKNIQLFLFLGFDGGRNGYPQAWASLSAAEQDFFVRYTVARLAPFAIITWNYVWEVEGNTENGELGCMRLVKKYDVFDHLRTYHDEKPPTNYWHLPEYTFAGVENHVTPTRDPSVWSAPWTHHDACLIGYVPGKPVYMVEGNALWRFYWVDKIIKETGHTVTMDEFRQSAWACATAAASFTWCGHKTITLNSSTGLPFGVSANPYSEAAGYIDILTDVMNNDVVFYRMTPQDNLLSECDPKKVWCLAESGAQYLVFSTGGSTFKLQLAAGYYAKNKWIDTKTGESQFAPAISADGSALSFSPPDNLTDWLLLVRTTPPTVVTITAPDDSAGETGDDQSLSFTIARTGDTTAALTVPLTVSGTATPEDDYTGITNSVIIPAGGSDVAMTLTVKSDGLAEGPEVVTLTIGSALGMVAGSPETATAAITDTPAPRINRPLSPANPAYVALDLQIKKVQKQIKAARKIDATEAREKKLDRLKAKLKKLKKTLRHL